jgi:hypothetical protein
MDVRWFMVQRVDHESEAKGAMNHNQGGHPDKGADKSACQDQWVNGLGRTAPDGNLWSRWLMIRLRCGCPGSSWACLGLTCTRRPETRPGGPLTSQCYVPA